MPVWKHVEAPMLIVILRDKRLFDVQELSVRGDSHFHMLALCFPCTLIHRLAIGFDLYVSPRDGKLINMLTVSLSLCLSAVALPSQAAEQCARRRL